MPILLAPQQLCHQSFFVVPIGTVNPAGYARRNGDMRSKWDNTERVVEADAPECRRAGFTAPAARLPDPNAEQASKRTMCRPTR
jgi:hypothetical protein